MNKMNKQIIQLLIFVVICYFFSTLPYLSFDDKSLLLNKEIWSQFYGSLAGFGSTIVFYNTKYGVHIHPEMITEIITTKKALVPFLNENNKSLFFDNSPEKAVLYQNYIQTMTDLQSNTQKFREFILDTSLDEETFNGFFSHTIKIYIRYLEAAKLILELDPSTEGNSHSLKLLTDFLDMLKNL